MTDAEVYALAERLRTINAERLADWRAGGFADPRGHEANRAALDLAREFASRHGWKLSPSFSEEALLAGKRVGAASYGPGVPGVDHAWFFQSSDGHAQAVVGFQYDDPTRIKTRAEANGLKYSIVDDFPGWYIVDDARMILLEREEAAGE